MDKGVVTAPISGGHVPNKSIEVNEGHEDHKETEKFLLTSPGGEGVEISQSTCAIITALQTVAAYGTYFGKGMLMAVLSSSLLDLELQTGSTSHQMALLITWQYLGRVPAALAFGLIADKFNNEVLLGFGMLVLAVVGTGFPFCADYKMLSILVGLSGCSMGFLGGSATHYMLLIWESPSALFGLHLALSFGSTIGPLVAKPFLSKQSMSAILLTDTVPASRITNNLTRLQLAPEVPHIMDLSTSVASQNATPTAGFEDISGGGGEGGRGGFMVNSALMYPYIIIGCLNLSVVLLCLVIFCINRQKRKLAQMNETKKNALESKVVTSYKIDTKFTIRRWVLLFMYCAFLLLDGAVEATYSGLLVIYAYREIHMSKETSTIINAVFWGTHCGGRVIGVFASKCGYLRLNIVVSVAIGLLSAIALSLLAGSHSIVVWICSVLFGLSFSTLIGNTLAVTKKTLQVSGFTVSMLLFSLYSGMMLGPATSSWLFKLFGIYTFPYVILTCLSSMLIIFMSTVLITL